MNVIPFLEVIGLPDSIVDILKNSQSGNALTAYAMFKVGFLTYRADCTLLGKLTVSSEMVFLFSSFKYPIVTYRLSNEQRVQT